MYDARKTNLYIGVDLHKHHHVAVIIDCWHKKLGEKKFENKLLLFQRFYWIFINIWTMV